MIFVNFMILIYDLGWKYLAIADSVDFAVSKIWNPEITDISLIYENF